MPPSSSTALDLALPVLRCPVCGEPLARADVALRCPRGHSFDVARQGYVSLLTGARPTSGDDAAMVAARLGFLATGAFDPILAALTDLVARRGNHPPAIADLPGSEVRPPVTVVDAGCGTGHYLAGTVEALGAERGVGLDSSTPALRAAARAHPRVAAVACDLFGALPIASGSADLLLDVFAPRNPAEFRRILKPDGTLVVTRPTTRHLAGLRQRVATMTDVDPAKESRLEQALDPFFEAIETVTTEYTVEVSAGAIADLVAMTPGPDPESVDPEGSDPASPDPVQPPAEIEVSVLTTAYRPRIS